MAPNKQFEEDPDVVIVKVNKLPSGPRTPARSTQTRYDDVSILDVVKTPPSPYPYTLPVPAPQVPLRSPAPPAGNFTPVEEVAPRPPVRPDPADRTRSHGEQDKWNLYYLPDILYVLCPGTEHVRSRAPVCMTEYTIFGKQVRDFAVLPRQISSRVEGWRLEAWMRLDQRITDQDIIDRVNPEFRAKLSPEYLEYRRQFFRETFNLACWTSPESISQICNLLVERGIDPAMNSTRGLTPGLKDPARGEAGGRVPLPIPQVCTIAADGGNQPIPTRFYVQPQPTPQNQYHGRVPMVYPPQAPFCSLTMPQHAFVQPSYMNPSQGSVQHVQYMAPYSVPHSYGKRKWAEPIRQETPLAYYKRQKISGHGYVECPTGYPNVPAELAPRRAPMPRAFPREGDMGGRTMSLEEYLQEKRVSYEEFLRARYAHEIPGIAGGLHYHPRRA
ncbi:hypothetical protein ATEIFO6365_0004013100 [Aspergillus terreus]|uniref:Uncharacterized protein n=1 Tax=Aspergillus terreus TaxID=33178 RepID=A0A5M3ZE45_ASPTE|nr:hypothetical protein ATETN484_0018000300 [Aspergillus terreus]GFF15012.1 hypothetical protein ATEIFO6365_0004013100 [Aspergillus terreus]